MQIRLMDPVMKTRRTFEVDQTTIISLLVQYEGENGFTIDENDRICGVVPNGKGVRIITSRTTKDPSEYQ